jgi:UDPglucose 6-dehydrogenase
MKIGIIGNGFVGKATRQLECNDIEILTYDINPELCYPTEITIKYMCDNCDLIFISVPTPMNHDGSCYLGIIENVVNDLKQYTDFNKSLIVLRSTIPPGTSDKFNCFFMPEFLTEKNYINDFINNKNWIFGLKNNEQDIAFKQKITELFQTAFLNNKIKYNNLLFCSTKEAEMIKYVRNCFLSVKISFFNEIYEFCKKKNIDFNTIREYATLDDRIGTSHTNVPGHDGKFGFGGTCFPKDMSSLNEEMKSINMKSYIISNSILRNDNVDRTDKDWLNNKGRSSL